jgi:RNA polymerase sigma-70 factor, ECF subfamily
MPTDILDSIEIDGREGAIAPVGGGVEAKDPVLVAAAKRGSIRAFDLLVNRHQGRILRIALRVIHNREDAEDIVQKSLQKAFVHLRGFEERASFSTWLTRIVINEAAMCLRKNRYARTIGIDDLARPEEPAIGFPISDSCLSPEQSYARQEAERMLFFAIGRLPPGLRTAIKLCYLDERSLKESAQMMGLSVAAVKARVLRGRRKLRETLKRFVRPARTFGFESFVIGAHVNAGSPSSAAPLVAVKSIGGRHGDNSSRSRADRLSVAVPRQPRRWKRIEPFSVSRR